MIALPKGERANILPAKDILQLVMKRFALFRHSPATLEQRFPEKRIYGGRS
jgi:hypothetical protein